MSGCESLLLVHGETSRAIKKNHLEALWPFPRVILNLLTLTGKTKQNKKQTKSLKKKIKHLTLNFAFIFEI